MPHECVSTALITNVMEKIANPHEASMFFAQTFSALVVNAKLERPLDSHAPQTEHVYAYVDDDWGEAYEDEYSHQWESSDKDDQYFKVQDTFASEDTNEEEALIEEQEQDNKKFDEDDQDNYS